MAVEESVGVRNTRKRQRSMGVWEWGIRVTEETKKSRGEWVNKGSMTRGK